VVNKGGFNLLVLNPQKPPKWLSNKYLLESIHLAPLNSFVNLSRVIEHHNTKLVLLKLHTTFLEGLAVNASTGGIDLSICRMFYCSSLNSTAAYLFEIPKGFYVKWSYLYLKILHKDSLKVEQFENIQKLFTNSDISVFSSGSSALLILCQKPFIKTQEK